MPTEIRVRVRNPRGKEQDKRLQSGTTSIAPRTASTGSMACRVVSEWTCVAGNLGPAVEEVHARQTLPNRLEDDKGKKGVEEPKLY